jgi:uncharacterized protein with HEPN domain
VRDIRDSAETALRYMVGKSRADLDSDTLLADAVVRRILVIGEAARHLSEELRARAPGIPWHEIVGSRHIMTHEYWRVDFDAVWTVATTGLTPLIEAMNAILAGAAEGGATETLDDGSAPAPSVPVA